MVQQDRRCPVFGGYAESGYILSQKGVLMLNPRFTLRTPASFCSNIPFLSFTKNGMGLLENFHQNMVSGPSNVLTC